MTADELARGYFIRARKRMQALRTLMAVEAYPDVVREAQELVELVLKGMLRWVGIDPPKWHDVGSILLEEQEKFSPEIRERIPELAAISLRLRRDGELAFYGDGISFPTRSMASRLRPRRSRMPNGCSRSYRSLSGRPERSRGT